VLPLSEMFKKFRLAFSRFNGFNFSSWKELYHYLLKIPLMLAKGHWTGSIKEAFSAANIANLA